MTYLARLTNEELLRHADNVRDPLTTTEVEIELAKRLAALIDDPELPAALIDDPELPAALIDDPELPAALAAACDATGIEPEHLPRLVELLDEHGAGDPERLAKKLKCAVDFQALADDAGDVFSRLSDLTNATT